MPILNEDLRRRLIAKYGTGVNLEANSQVVSDLLKELASGIGDQAILDPGTVMAYDKTYTEGYNKEDYSRGSYQRYDRTDGGIFEDMYEDVLSNIRPELDKMIIEKLRVSDKTKKP
jgi:hypothetical protein